MNQAFRSQRHSRKVSRRNFLGTAAAAAAVFTIVPRRVLGGPGYLAPSDRLNLAIIGTGGQGIVDMKNLLPLPDTQVRAVCDVSEDRDYSAFYFGGRAGRKPAQQIAESFYAENAKSGKYKGCATYVDFNDLLANEKDIDGVVVATTDNLHAPVSMAAIRAGKHVYCEKPLTHTVHEARQLTEAARKAGIATQMGNSGQASEETRLLSEFIWDGAIGPVREVHIWSNRPIWPQGIDRPTGTPPVPSTLDWNGWLGPAPYRPYHPDYLPFVWRGWQDFGTGALGDMGCHRFDPIFRALKLGHPTSVEASGSQYMEQTYTDSFPRAAIVRYEFPARGDLPPVTLTWYDGGLKPPRPAELEDEREMGNQGTLIIGDRGKMLNGQLIPESKMKAHPRPPQSLPRSIGHYEEWLAACRGGQPAGSNFDFAGLVTEVVLLGNVALRAGGKLQWDGPNLKVTNLTEANDLIHRPYREGWTL